MGVIEILVIAISVNVFLFIIVRGITDYIVNRKRDKDRKDKIKWY